MKLSSAARFRHPSNLLWGALFLAATASVSVLPTLYARSAPGRWIEVQRLAGNVTIHRSEAREAQVGDRLQAVGHGLTTRELSSANLGVDTAIGSLAVAQNTEMSVQRLDVLRDGARVTILDVPQGQVRIQVRAFTHANSRLELRTPAGAAAVRGTEFGVSVAEDGRTSIATLEGTVDAIGQLVRVPVNPGFVSIIHPGEVPTTPHPLDRELAIDWQIQERRANQLRVSGNIDVANTISVQGKEIPISRSGYFETTLFLGSPNGRVTLTVANPLGEARDHIILPRQLPNLDRGGPTPGA